VCRALDVLAPEWFGFCDGSSHDQIGRPRPLDLLTHLRQPLIAVQLSDRIRDFVDHMRPDEGFINWPALCAELHQARCEQPLMLEVATTHSATKDPHEFLPRAHHQATKLAGLVAQPGRGSE